ncbi:MAG TPA: arabinan endo-1,5-alpha-L-arabinosidase [Polyangia bacterium]
MRSLSFYCLRSAVGLALVGSLACSGGTDATGAGGTSGPSGQAGTSAGGGTGGSAPGGTSGAAGDGGSGDAGTTGSGGSGGSVVTGTAGDGSGGAGTSGTAGTAGTGTAGAGGGTAGARGGTTGTAGASAGRGGTTGTAGAGGRGGTTGAAGSGPGGQPACPGTTGTTPMAPLTLTGSLGAHDPAALVVNNTIYMFATGLTAKTSTNLTSWTGGSNPLNPRPAWVAQNVPGATNLWAPDIVYFGGTYHLYYAASTFGSNKSCIGHATKTDIASGSWADQGTVICSNMGSSDNWNAIDPNVVIDDAGTPWMDFGSFWGGIKMIKLDATTGGRATDDMMVYSIADRPGGRGGPEGPWIIKRCGYYYLFESWGACCDGAYDYNMRVGRSTSVNKDYVDKAGMKLLGGGGGTLVSQGNSTVHAPGHNAVIVYNNKTYNLYHALNASNGNASLHITELVWDADGWPVQHDP